MMRWISLINKLFSDTNISNGSVATSDAFEVKFSGDYNSERIVKIGQLTKLCVEHLGFTFLAHPVVYMYMTYTGCRISSANTVTFMTRFSLTDTLCIYKLFQTGRRYL